MESKLFTIGQVSSATYVNAETIRGWFKRGILEPDISNVGRPDNTRMLSLDTAIRIAVMGRLGALGLPPIFVRDCISPVDFDGWYELERWMPNTKDGFRTYLLIPTDSRKSHKILMAERIEISAETSQDIIIPISDIIEWIMKNLGLLPELETIA